ncbi:hypothetical protein NDU88_005168 [Pleurodeles waltl]|uniref:Uncharacterized protein n=1 Tax=Pleurodeles waltl TaxID=8319 RepID=A0AAV7V383_PLEWA|nr:hypothetical protein NDU88_005168 [Pleurodeles waltl]
MQSSVGRQGLTSTKLGLKSHWTVGVTWTELLSSRDLARRAERRPRGPVMQFLGPAVAGGRFRRPTGDFFGASSAERRQTTPTACTTRKTVEKAAGSALQGRSSRCCYFVAVLQASHRSQQSIPWQKVKREMQRNTDELLHSLSKEFPKAETLNSQKRRFGYLGERIG